MNNFANAYLAALNPRAVATHHTVAGQEDITGLALGGVDLSLAEGIYKLVYAAQVLMESIAREIATARNRLAQPVRRAQDCPSG